MDILFIILIIFILVGVKVNKSGFYDNYLSSQYTNQLKGIFALVVIFHHLSQRTNGGLLFILFSLVGYLAVSMFFFVTGYGLMVQYQKRKENYLKSFLLLRMPTILIPYLFANIIYFTVYVIIGKDVTIKFLLLSLINGDPLVSFSWYVIAITVFYLLFYLSGKLCKGNSSKLIVTVFLGLCIYILVCYILGYGSWWYNSCFTFILGMIWAVYYKKLTQFSQKKYLMKLSMSFLIFIIFFIIPFLLNKSEFSSRIFSNIELVCKLLSASFFSVIVIIVGQKVQFSSKILTIFGVISFELYLMHGLVITLLRTDKFYLQSDIIFSVSVIIITIILSIIFHSIFNWIIKKYKTFVS